MKKEVIVCDKCENVIEDDAPWVLDLSCEDKHRGMWELCDGCWEELELEVPDEEVKPAKKKPQKPAAAGKSSAGRKADSALRIKFGSKPVCRLSDTFGSLVRDREYIRVIANLSGQGQVQVDFPNQKDEHTYTLSRTSGTCFSCGKLLRVTNLDDKTIEFKDQGGGKYIGEINN